ncbi:MAG: hypothetical protein HY335_08015 [Deinococcus sp.]|nr:hypothetical protein [Deinococcus sp.]
MQERKIGVLAGSGRYFPEAFIERVNSLEVPGVSAEFIKLGGTKMAEPNRYRVILDRASHQVRYYRLFLKNAALSGTYLINDPFWYSADDPFFQYCLATRAGIATPRTVCLPSKSYVGYQVDPEALRNLEYPLDWDGIIEHVGFPAYLKPCDGGGAAASKVHSKEEMLRAYDQSGTSVLVLQEAIEFEKYLRVFCIGRKYVLPAPYDPQQQRYLPDYPYVSAELGQHLVQDTLLLNQLLGYDMNTVDFAVRDGIPYAIDFLNPVPDFDPESITWPHFEWLVEKMAELAVEHAQSDQRNLFFTNWKSQLKDRLP